MKVYIYGDSHTAALHRGLATPGQSIREELNLDLRIIPLGGGHLLPTPFFTEREEFVEITNPDYKKRVKRIPPLENPPDVIGLSMPLWPMRVLHALVWNNYSLPTGLDGRKPISMAFFRNLVLEDQKFVLRLVDFLRQLKIPLLAIAPPGLFCDHGTVKRFGKNIRFRFSMPIRTK